VQYQNAAAAIAALRCLGERLPLPVKALRAGLTRVRLAGRFQVIPGEVTWILDVAHNREAAETLGANLRAFPCSGRRRAVLAVLADKDPEAIAKPLIPWVETWILSQSGDPRAMSVDRLAAGVAGVLGDADRQVVPDLAGALDRALALSVPGDCVLVYGSFTTVEAALRRVGADASAGILPP
jgi:dihydrofolate synthase/folylpolyglutamate synthase